MTKLERIKSDTLKSLVGTANLASDTRGATMFEYIVPVFAIGLLGMAAFFGVGTSMKTAIGNDADGQGFQVAVSAQAGEAPVAPDATGQGGTGTGPGGVCTLDDYAAKLCIPAEVVATGAYDPSGGSGNGGAGLPPGTLDAEAAEGGGGGGGGGIIGFVSGVVGGATGLIDRVLPGDGFLGEDGFFAHDPIDWVLPGDGYLGDDGFLNAGPIDWISPDFLTGDGGWLEDGAQALDRVLPGDGLALLNPLNVPLLGIPLLNDNFGEQISDAIKDFTGKGDKAGDTKTDEPTTGEPTLPTGTEETPPTGADVPPTAPPSSPPAEGPSPGGGGGSGGGGSSGGGTTTGSTAPAPLPPPPIVDTTDMDGDGVPDGVDDPTFSDPTTTDPVDPVTGEPVTTDPTTGEPTTADPTTGDPIVVDPTLPGPTDTTDPMIGAGEDVTQDVLGGGGDIGGGGGTATDSPMGGGSAGGGDATGGGADGTAAGGGSGSTDDGSTADADLPPCTGTTGATGTTTGAAATTEGGGTATDSPMGKPKCRDAAATTGGAASTGAAGAVPPAGGGKKASSVKRRSRAKRFHFSR